MMKLKKIRLNPIYWIKRLFQRKAKPFLLDGKYKIVPAFELKGEMYYMHEDPLTVLAGRGLYAMTFLEELLMRCSVDFLKYHTEAVEKILSDPKGINIQKLAVLNSNLKERINMLVAIPDHVFKLASVVFFKADESPFMYDQAAASKNIKHWKKTGHMYDFFLRMTPLKTLLPSLLLQDGNMENYLKVQEVIHEQHLKNLSGALCKPLSTIDI